VRRWQPPPAARRPVRRALRWYERPIEWWGRHPWVPAWITVALTPVVLFCLRLIDESDVADLVQPPILALTVAVLLVTIAVAARSSAAHSLSRAVVGGGGALLGAALLVLPMTQIIGHRPCPDRLGLDRGLHVATQTLDAWRRGGLPPDDVWASTAVADGWRQRVRDVALLDFKLDDSGCWERLAPVTTNKTWHEYRVTVRRGDGERFSKVVTVHTRAARDGWKIVGIEGP
jgi:hypothetical protein